MSVHYKFKSALSFDTITFDGLHISIKDLKKAILQQKQIGKASDFDLQITNAQSNEVYEDESTLVPKNSSLIVVRVPLTTQQKKSSEKSDVLPALGKGAQDGLDPAVNKLAKTVDLTNVDASETDKIQAAITQSTLEYDPSNYLRIKGSNQVGELPANYRCYKCLQPGHWIRDCKLNSQPDSSVDIKKSTGIPRSFMVPVEGPEVPGAMMTPTGHFAVPSIEHEARKEPLKKLKEPVVVEKPIIPNDLMCGVCKDLLTDAVLIPCCGNSFCDECIRNVLLESEDHQCPDCREKDVSPDTLIPNRFLRNSVNSFRNKTGYVKAIPVKTASALPEKPPSPKLEAAPEKLKVKDSHLEDGELEIVEESSSTQGQPSGSIPSLTNPPPIADPTILPTNFEQGSNTVENLLPIPNLAVNSRSQPNYISHKGDETSHYIKKEKLYNNRHERSGTPTIDENRYRIESLGGMQPRIPPPMQQPMLYTHGYMYHQRPPQYIPPRPDMTPYPPGVDDPNMIRMPYGHRLPYNHRPRAPYSMSHNGNNQPGMLTNTLELFTKIINDKEKRRNRIKRRSRSITRSYSRSPSPKRYRGRSRSLRSRSRTRSRTPRSRTRSRSRSAYIRKRSRSRSFSMSRSPYSERSGNRSLSRERHFSPSRRRDYRHSPNYRASPHRYYSKKYKEEHASHSLKVPERRSRHASKQDYYPPDYPRRTDRYESRYKERERDHEKDRERDKDRGHHRKYDELDAREIAKQAGLDLRAKVADDWEKTRDRELELRKKEAQQQLYSQEKSRKDQSQVEAIESTSREELRPPGVADEDRSRVLVSVHCDQVKETSKSPEKEKKKEKRKKKKEEVDRKKKKKKKDKKDEDGEDTSKNLYEDEVKLDQEIIQKYTETPKEEKDVVLAPLPELSKWEKDEETAPSEENKKPNEESKVTSEVIKRAENAIFKKIHIKPIDAKKPERRVKLAEKEEKEEKPEKKEKDRRKNDKEERAPRSVALPVEKDRKNVPQRISAKERLGAKVDDKVVIKHEIRERREIKVLEKKPKEKMEIKKLSEENFEPDYEKEEEVKDEPKKRSLSPETEPEAKKLKEDKAKSSSPDSSLSSDDSEKHHKKRKKAKKHKKRRKKKKHGSSSDSDSSTSSSDSESEKKKRRHKHKSHKKSKKRKKSKK